MAEDFAACCGDETCSGLCGAEELPEEEDDEPEFEGEYEPGVFGRTDPH